MFSRWPEQWNPGVRSWTPINMVWSLNYSGTERKFSSQNISLTYSALRDIQKHFLYYIEKRAYHRDHNHIQYQTFTTSFACTSFTYSSKTEKSRWHLRLKKCSLDCVSTLMLLVSCYYSSSASVLWTWIALVLNAKACSWETPLTVF